MFAFNVAVLASLFMSTAALAQVAVPATAAPTQVTEKKICRSEVPLGSIRSKRTCLTKSQWAALHAQNGDAADRALESARARASVGGVSAQ